MMCEFINIINKKNIRCVIGFLNERNIKQTEIHRQNYEIHGEHVTTDTILQIGATF